MPDNLMKESAARLYESCVFDRLLGDALRPGGLHLTARLAEVAGVDRDDEVLDIACGKGTTAFYLAGGYGCRVTGIDLSEKMIARCRDRGAAEGSDRVSFLLADGENLPFRDGSFDIVVSECSLSLMPDKERAAREIHRVLRPGGRLAMTDIVLRGEVSEDLRGRTSFACCLAGAWSAAEYIALFERVGFLPPGIEDHSSEMRRIAFQLVEAFGSLDGFEGSLPVEPCRRKGTVRAETVSSPGSLVEFMRLGKPGYALLVAARP